ncbi:MAG: HesA/MoeB/ThiF family protein [Spirochaetales bacterium]|nr:HesA/MoeB/ThiF family protein [Spirochaetales bacterium]
MDFTNDQIQRYSRHILLKDVGGIGQKKLLDSRVLVVGAGGLGSPIATYLAAAGVGTIGIVDADVVDLSNLQRQILHHTADVGKKKVDSAKSTINSLNPDVQVETHPYRLDASNIRSIIREYDFVLEGTDNFPSKFLVNDACILEDKAYNQGGILRFKGQTMTHIPGSASYRCVYREPPPPGAVPSCSEAGVLGAIAGILGTIQAAEALKYLTGAGTLLTNRILTFDALAMDFRTIPVEATKWAIKSSDGGKSPDELIEYEQTVCDLSSHASQGGTS